MILATLEVGLLPSVWFDHQQRSFAVIALFWLLFCGTCLKGLFFIVLHDCSSVDVVLPLRSPFLLAAGAGRGWPAGHTQ